MPDQPSARRTQRERREQAERKVLAAATALIAQHGSRALTLAEVGEAAGYSRGIVSHHFGSRENLLRAVMWDARTFTLPDPGESAADWLADTVRAYLKNVTSRRPAAAAFLQMWGEAIAADPVLMPLYNAEATGVDEEMILSDPRLAGSDTVATAYAVGHAVFKIYEKHVVPFDEPQAHAAGSLLGKTSTRDVVDASVAVVSIRHGADIVSDDAADIQRLLSAARGKAAIIEV